MHDGINNLQRVVSCGSPYRLALSWLVRRACSPAPPVLNETCIASTVALKSRHICQKALRTSPKAEVKLTRTLLAGERYAVSLTAVRVFLKAIQSARIYVEDL